MYFLKAMTSRRSNSFLLLQNPWTSITKLRFGRTHAFPLLWPQESRCVMPEQHCTLCASRWRGQATQRSRRGATGSHLSVAQRVKLPRGNRVGYTMFPSNSKANCSQSGTNQPGAGESNERADRLALFPCLTEWKGVSCPQQPPMDERAQQDDSFSQSELSIRTLGDHVPTAIPMRLGSQLGVNPSLNGLRAFALANRNLGHAGLGQGLGEPALGLDSGSGLGAGPGLGIGLGLGLRLGLRLGSGPGLGLGAGVGVMARHGSVAVASGSGARLPVPLSSRPYIQSLIPPSASPLTQTLRSGLTDGHTRCAAMRWHSRRRKGNGWRMVPTHNNWCQSIITGPAGGMGVYQFVPSERVEGISIAPLTQIFIKLLTPAVPLPQGSVPSLRPSQG